jgi:hypothetical protein
MGVRDEKLEKPALQPLVMSVPVLVLVLVTLLVLMAVAM